MNQLKQIHAHGLRRGANHTKTLIVQLLQIQNIPYAQNLFDNIPQPTVFLYNKLIQAYSSRNQPNQCLALYNQMCLKNCHPNHHTFTFMFTAFASFTSPLPGKMLHAHFVKSGFESDAYALTALVDMYAKLGNIVLARKVFDGMADRDIPTWNSLIAGYSRSGCMEEALKLFRLMPGRNVVSWTTIISGYSQNGQYEMALDMFLKMEKEKSVRPNEVTIASVLPACANTGALRVGERIEAFARENGMLRNLYVSNALLDLFSRCGQIDVGKRVFDEIGKRKTVCSWNSMIMGFAIHGRSNEALQLYAQSSSALCSNAGIKSVFYSFREGIAPDDVTFVGLILACTHGGLVEKGRQLFESMKTKFSISPKLEHYGCMVDLLARAGELGEAYDLIKSMRMKPDSVTWGALLGACSFHNNVEFAEIAAERLFELEPWNPGNYVILSNIYASSGRWDGVAKVREMMKGGQIRKAAGSSFIEEGGELHKFMVEDWTHPRCGEIYALLKEITAKMKLYITLNDLEYELEELCIME